MRVNPETESDLDKIVALAKTNPVADVEINLSHNAEKIAEGCYREGNRRIIISLIINDNPRAEQFVHEFPTKPIKQ